MTTIYFVRHGITAANLRHEMQGSTDAELCAEGRAQLPFLAEAFRDVSIDAIYASNARRALETAGAIAAPRGMEIRIREDLRERDARDYEGYLVSALLTMAGADQENGAPVHPARFEFGNAETIPQVYARVCPAIYKILAENKGRTIVVVSHGMALQMMIACLTHEEIHAYTCKKLKNLSISKAVEDDENRVTFLYFGDLSFLPDAVRTQDEI